MRDQEEGVKDGACDAEEGDGGAAADGARHHRDRPRAVLPLGSGKLNAFYLK